MIETFFNSPVLLFLIPIIVGLFLIKLLKSELMAFFVTALLSSGFLVIHNFYHDEIKIIYNNIDAHQYRKILTDQNETLDDLLDNFKNRAKKIKKEPLRKNDSFEENEIVKCIVTFVLSWDNGEEFTRDDVAQCYVKKIPKNNNSTMLVDCSEFFDQNSSNIPGAGLVKNHHLHKKIRWTFQDRCFKL